MTQYISFDIGGTTIKHAVVDEQGVITDRDVFDTVDDSNDIVTKMVAVVKTAQSRYDIAGIGVSTPGIVQEDGFMLTGGAISALNKFPLARILKEQTGLAVAVENDANAAAIAEHWMGAAQGVQTYLAVVLGTGVGGGIVIDGHVYRGAHGMAGEFGWNVIHDVDPTLELETFSINWRASVVSGLVRRYNLSCHQALADDRKLTDAREILDQAKAGDGLAAGAVNEFIRDVTIMVLNMFANFDPEKILIGGGISANDYFMQALQDSVNEYISRHESLNRIRNTALGKLETAQLRNDAGLIGATYRIRQQLA